MHTNQLGNKLLAECYFRSWPKWHFAWISVSFWRSYERSKFLKKC